VTSPTRETQPMSSGIDQAALDSSVRPQDDFFAAINGQWLRDFQIPEDKAQYASFTALHDAAEEQLHDIVTELVSKADLSVAANSDSQSPAAQVSILYSDFMDTERLNEIGVAALDPVLRRIAEITSVDQLPSVFGEFDRWGLRAPVGVFVHQDNKDATQYICDIRQSGLGLPDRDFYLDEKFTEILQQYRAHIARMWVLAGWGEETEALDVAGRIVEVETALATAHWDKVRNRDPEATYNRLTLQELVQLAPGFDARSFLAGAKIPADLASVNVGQPDYLNSLEQILQDTPLLAWREYLQWSTLAAMASLLDGTLDAANFDFFGTTLSGVPAQRARWKRAVGLAESAVGEALGQIYVERYFPPENKARMVELVDNLIAAYSEAIDDLEWMTGETKEQAHNKLATFRPKIGYPDTWRDYSGLRLVPGDVVGNVIAANVFEHDREIAKVGGPVDRDEWFMSPQTVNAYYNPEMNEIVFPAAILQPPFFNMEADDAVNYGGIGAVIGHEISHGFDDKGSQYDGQGNLRNWWTEQDSTAFEERTKALTDQYSAYEPIDGHQINGELTLGENIADVSGLAVSLRAYRRSLGVDDAAEIDGLTGEQRFFAGWAQVWRAKTREQEEIRRLAIDPHSPPEYRVLGVLVNSDDFVEAFHVKPGDQMWREPAQRVRIW
jgi:putative endopeptidase